MEVVFHSRHPLGIYIIHYPVPLPVLIPKAPLVFMSEFKKKHHDCTWGARKARKDFGRPLSPQSTLVT